MALAHTNAKEMFQSIDYKGSLLFHSIHLLLIDYSLTNKHLKLAQFNQLPYWSPLRSNQSTEGNIEVCECALDMRWWIARLVGYNHLISNKREWNNCFNKNAHKIPRILPDFICKTTDFQLVFNFEQTRTVTIFEEHGIMAHIPWWLSQSEL